jgi:hypothetical protein
MRRSMPSTREPTQRRSKPERTILSRCVDGAGHGSAPSTSCAGQSCCTALIVPHGDLEQLPEVVLSGVWVSVDRRFEQDAIYAEATAFCGDRARYLRPRGRVCVFLAIKGVQRPGGGVTRVEALHISAVVGLTALVSRGINVRSLLLSVSPKHHRRAVNRRCSAASRTGADGVVVNVDTKRRQRKP